MKLFLIFIILLNCSLIWGQEKITINGYVYDRNTGEVLIGATVFENNSNEGTTTNEYGYYSLQLNKQDSILLRVSYIGYTAQQKIIYKKGRKADFYLKPGIPLNEVEVIAPNTKIVERNETGVTRLKMKEIKTMPNLFGEVDIIKVYQLTPGVQSGGEGKSNIYVRGGTPDQNLILLDEVPLYYVAHFGGFFSVFNADAINNVKLIKGGFPARYGGRLSSVLDIRMKEGNMKKFSTQGTLGLLSSKVSFEAPIIKNKSSFILSFRRSTPFLYLLNNEITNKFYDFNAKMNFKFFSNNKVFFSFYKGDDAVNFKEKAELVNSKKQTSWGNTLGAIRWNHIYNNKLFSNLTLYGTYYRYKNLFIYDFNSDSLSFFQKRKNSLITSINDYGMKFDFDFTLNDIINLKFGFNTIHHTFVPNDQFYSQSGSAIPSLKKDYNEKVMAFENAIYLENQINFKKININLGLRYSGYLIKQHFYHLPEPRILVNYMISNKWAFKYSFSAMNQYVHLLSYSGVGVPSDYWMPTNENINPEKSFQHNAGIYKSFAKNKFELSIETYYKTLNNLITFKPGESLSGNFSTWENVIEKNGTGLNYGIELFFKKLSGKTTGWLGVTLGKSQRKFNNIDGGEPYPFKYDRLLDINFVTTHKVNNKIYLSATWTYGSGYPITIANDHYYMNNDDVFVYGSKNSFRMRDYHRLDIAVNFPKKTEWGKRTWTISIFNLYNRQNPYYYYYDKKIKTIETTSQNGGVSSSPIYEKPKLYQRSLFPIFPSFSYSFEF